MKRNSLISFFGCLLIISLAALSACSPALGASWYAKSGTKSAGQQMYIASIKVADREVEIKDVAAQSQDGKTSLVQAKRFAISLPNSVETIDIGSIKIEAYESEKKETPIKVSLEVEGDSVPLVPGEVVSVVVRIKDDSGRFRQEEKFISVKREAVQAVDLMIEKLEVYGAEVAWNEESKTGTVELAYSKGVSVTSGDIKALFKIGSETKVLPVVVTGEEVELKIGEAVEIACAIAPSKNKKNLYNEYSFKINCTRLEKKEGEEEPLKLKTLSVCKVNAKSSVVKVSKEVTQVTAEDVVAVFDVFDALPVKLQQDAVTFDDEGKAVLEITVAAEAGQYSEWKRTIQVVHGEGASSDEEQDGQAGDEDSNEEEGGLPKLNNPKDENGNEKFIVKVTSKTEELDPFDYYKENHGDFSASSFDGWVLNMTGIASDNVPSYAFVPGSWEGSNPATCQGETIGVGQTNKTWNLKYYKYASQAERWEGRYSPSLDDAEKKKRERFVFFRFTGDASAGTHLDSSMFCVDTVTKFLFYYSAPQDISGFGVPSNWRDYEEPSAGRHVQSSVPFYMTDPIGYVEKDGKCVIYGWCKDHIRANDYTPPLSNSFSKPASRKPGGSGFSPYKNKIKKVTKERSVQKNPEYTVAKPVITKQSGALYLTLDSREEVKVSVDVKAVPEDEGLSYQWYTNTTNAEEGASAIDGATNSSHTFEKQVMDVYCWCVVTNKNTENGKTASTSSQAVKVRVAKNTEELKIDAEMPHITQHPKSSQHKFVQGENVEVTLLVKVKKPGDKGVLSYQWFENTEDSATGGTEISGAVSESYKVSITDAGTKYYYCEVTNTSAKATGEKTAKIASAVAKVEVEEQYEMEVSCTEGGTLTVFGSEDAKTVKVNSGNSKRLKVKLGSQLVFIAKETRGYKWKAWEGDVETLGENTSAKIVLDTKEKIEKGVGVEFEKIERKGTLLVNSVAIENISLTGSYWGEKDYTYFDWIIKVGVEDDRTGFIYTDVWKKEKVYFTKQDKGASACLLPTADNKQIGVLLKNKKATARLKMMLQKRDSDGAAWIFENEFYISELEKNIIELEYDAEGDLWKVKDGEFNKIPTVTLKFDKGFTLKRGETKNLPIEYKVNNSAKHATGVAKVIYTLGWE